MNAGTSDASFFFAIEFKPPAFTNLQKNHSQLDLFHVFLWALSSPPGAEWLIAQKPIPKFLINSYQPPSATGGGSMRNHDFVSNGFLALIALCLVLLCSILVIAFG